jgi:hypothetical protein
MQDDCIRVTCRTIQSKTLRDREITVYKTIILSMVLYGCEMLSLTLRKEKDWGENFIIMSFTTSTHSDA